MSSLLIFIKKGTGKELKIINISESALVIKHCIWDTIQDSDYAFELNFISAHLHNSVTI